MYTYMFLDVYVPCMYTLMFLSSECLIKGIEKDHHLVMAPKYSFLYKCISIHGQSLEIVTQNWMLKGFQ